MVAVTSNYNGAQISCFGGSDGSAEASPSGGTPSYTFSWNTVPVQTTAVATGLADGTYTVVVTDANNCTVSRNVTLVQPSQVVASIASSVSVSCFGTATGTATVGAVGGTGSYGFSWSTTPIQNTATATGLVAGVYQVTAQDVNSCSSVAMVTITEPASAVNATAAVASNYNGRDVSCAGASDGSATVAPVGGTPGYTFSWNTVPVQTTATATGLAAGSYVVTVRDANNCTTTASVTLTEPSPIVASIASSTSVTCFGAATGSAVAAGSGGTGSYNFAWSNGVNAATNPNLAAGSYTVTVSDVNSCSATAVAVINQPATAVSVTAVVTSDFNGRNISCFGAADGEATATGTGGTGTLLYSWSTNPIQNTAIATGLAAGIYQVTVTDANNCQATTSVTVTEPTPLVAAIDANTSVSCRGSATGALVASVSGGNGGYSYFWNNGANTSSVAGLLAGVYCLTVTDNNLCSTSICTTIAEPSTNVSLVAAVTSDYNGQDVSCFGATDGEVTATGTGGTGLISYVWSTNPNQTTAVVSGLAAGTYVVTATDENACQAVESVVITQPTQLLLSTLSQTDVACFGQTTGSVEVGTTGGTGLINFLWSNNQNTRLATGLAAGNYCVTATDANMCQNTLCINITQPIAPISLAPAITSDYNGVQISCNGAADGSAAVFAAGGTGTYTYLWSNGSTTATTTGLGAGQHCVTVTDQNGCVNQSCVTLTQPSLVQALVQNVVNVDCRSASTGSATVAGSGGVGGYTFVWSGGNAGGRTTSSIVGLTAGIYCVTITDRNGCNSSTCLTITEPATGVLVSAAVVSSYNGQDVSCFGVADGVANATATGGTGSINYLWDINSQTTATATGLANGTYCVTVTDANACSATTCVVLTEPTPVVSSIISLTNVSCRLGDNGQATVAASGGTGATYTYLWSDGQTGTTAIGLSAGLYSVTSTDINGCQGVSSLTITEPVSSVSVTAAVTSNYNGAQVSCFGRSDASALATASGGTGGYSFIWSANTSGQTTSQATGLGIGTYSVTVLDASGCAAQTNVTITQPSLVIANIISTVDARCFGDNNGSATAGAVGGIAPYSFVWESSAFGQTTATATGLTAGSYNVTVLDANLCSSVAVAVIGQPISPVDAEAQVTSSYNGAQISCFGANDGAASVVVTDGTAPYTFLWQDGQTTSTATGLAAGSYVATVTDARGCQDTAFVELTAPSPVSSVITSVTNVDCIGNQSGSATISGSGGTGTFSFVWNTSPVQTAQTATGLAAGLYNVTVGDLNNCIAISSVTISEPAQAVVVVTSSMATSCNGSQDGEAVVVASGGTAPYTYLWSANANNQLSATATGLTAGNYQVTVTDANGCQAIGTIAVTQPAIINPVVVNVSQVSCFSGNDGFATVNASGGTQPYGFVWSNGQTGATATGLVAGSYLFTVTDASLCSAVGVVTVTQPNARLDAGLTVSSNYNGAQISCFGATDGSITVATTGGVNPYSFVWSDGQTSVTATGLAAGSHSVIVTDANGCTTSSSASINPPATLTVALVSSIDVDCRGNATGQITVSGVGGTGSYTYLWNTIPQQNQATATGLIAGSYTVTVEDVNGCVSQLTIDVTEPTTTVAPIATITSSYNGSQLSCVGSSDAVASVAVTGGVAPYSFEWSNGGLAATTTGLNAGVHNVTVTDSRGCEVVASVTVQNPTPLTLSVVNTTNVDCAGGATGTATVQAQGGSGSYSYLWQNGQTTVTSTGLAAGSYLVTATDNNGCSISTTAVITVPAASLSLNTVVVSNYNGSQLSCFGSADGIAEVTVSNGTSPYAILWSNGQTTTIATGLAAGTHCLTVTDANGCRAASCVDVNAPQPFIAAISSTQNVNCFGGTSGTATASVSGGTGSSSFIWSTTPSQTNSIATGLAQGIYSLTATDVNGCQSITSTTITQPSNPITATVVVASNYNAQAISCFGSSDGSLVVNASGGTGAYTYLWSNGSVLNVATGLAAGNHQVTVTDALGCFVTSNFTLNNPPSISLTTSSTPANCFATTTGTATVVATGGTGSYTYLWQDGQTSPTAVGLTAGSYTVTVQDQNLCIRTANVTVGQPASSLAGTIQVSSNYSGQQIACFGGVDGILTANTSGGTSPYTFLWSDGQTTAQATGLAAGTYCVTMTDDAGCEIAVCETLVQPSSLAINVTSQSDVSCRGTATGRASVSVTGGTAPYTYQWSNGETTANAIALAQGLQVLTVTDANACERILSIVVSEPVQGVSVTTQVVSNYNGQAISCAGESDAILSATGFGGTAPYTYQWSSGTLGNTVSGLPSGNYQVTVTDANNCQTTGFITVTQPTQVTATIVSSVSVDCVGQATGSATAAGLGGTGTYSFVWNTNPVQTTATASGLSAGSYTVTVTDRNGCAQTSSVVISQPASSINTVAVATSNYNGSQISCFGASDGVAEVSVVNGTAPYTFFWSNGQTTTQATGLAAGAYCATVTDVNGCSSVSCVTLTQPSQVNTFVANLVDVDCHGAATGQATVGISGGTGTYTYLWNTTPAQTNATATGLALGNYCVTVVDLNGCADDICLSINQPSSPLLASASVVSNYNGQQLSCHNASDAILAASGQGGTAPYSYVWSVAASFGDTLAGVSSGNYFVTITDANNCFAIASVSVTPPSPLAVQTTASNNVSCNGGNNGSANATPQGGTAPYSFVWSNGTSTASIFNLAAGSYTVTVTDANNCSVTGSVVITQPISGVSALTSVVSNYNGQQVSCHSAADGQAEVSGFGGTQPYAFLWDATTGGQTTQVATGLLPNINYSVTVTDASGCVAVSSISLTAPSQVLATVVSSTSVSCAGTATGTATATGQGGTTPYSFEWSNGDLTATATGLPAGIHAVTVTDVNGCSSSAFVTITQPANQLSVLALVASNYNGADITCFGASDGAVSVQIAGGISPYNVLWNTSNTTLAVTGLAAGNYTVTVTDAAGCEQTAGVQLQAPAPLAASVVTQLNISCRGDSTGVVTIQATAGTGTPGYTYTINAPIPSNNGTFVGLPAGGYTVTVSDLNFCSTTVPVVITQPASRITLAASVSSNYNGRQVSCFGASDASATAIATNGQAPYSFQWDAAANAQTTNIATGLAAGTYSVVATDANGCSATSTVTVTQPAQLAATLVSTTNVQCAGTPTGRVTLQASGGTPNYTFEVAGIISNNGVINGLTDGNYVVTVTDRNGCQTTVPVVILGPAPLQITAINVTSNYNGADISCHNACDGAATVVAAGGTGVYNFLWDNGQTTFTASGLCANHTVTVTDALGCTVAANVTLNQPAPLVAGIATQQNVSCNGASTGGVQINATGGTPAYSYNLGTGVQASNVFSGLVAGNYRVTVTDLNGCTSFVPVTITQTAPINVVATVSSNYNGQQLSCAGGADATAQASATGGTAPYSFAWGTSPVQTSAVATGLAAGVYQVTITDANGCIGTSQITVTAPASLDLVITNQVDVNCAGSATGSFRVQPSGGVAPYTFSINGGNTFTNTVQYTNLAAGNYCVIARDANGCVDTVCTTIQQPAPLQAQITSQVDVSCNGVADGRVTVQGIGGQAPYQYQFNFSGVYANQNNFENLNAGNYTIQVRDANGCIFPIPVTITQPAGLQLNILAANSPNCNGNTNGSIEVAAANGTGTAPYEYSIDGNNFRPSGLFTNLNGGTYTLTVRDFQGCQTSRVITITDPASVVTTTSITSNYNGRQVSCNGASDGAAQVIAGGGTLPFAYQWSQGATTSAVNGLAANVTYFVTVSDANGCSRVDSVRLTQPAVLTASLLAQTNIGCAGQTTGSLTIAANPNTGTGPYTYSIGGGFTTQNTFNNLAAGNYIVSISDANGCQATLPVIITEPAPLVVNSATVTSNYNGQQVSCATANDGVAQVQASGGNGILAYVWSVSTGSQTTAIATGLAAGTHRVTITDANGCTATAAVTVTAPSPLTATVVVNGGAGCFGGSNGQLDATASGGTAPYLYAINGGTPQTSGSFTNLSAGTYTITILDANNCTTTRTAVIGQAGLLNATAAVTSSYNGLPISCNNSSNGTATVAVSGGGLPYTYLWSNGGTSMNVTGLGAGVHTVTITDANSCSTTASVSITAPASVSLSTANQADVTCFGGNNGSFRVQALGGAGTYTFSSNFGSNASGQFNNIPAGTYTVSVSDANGCTATTVVSVSEPSAISVSLTTNNVSCFGLSDGLVEASVTGGTPLANGRYLYAWNNGRTTTTIGNLPAGNYIITVSDAVGCTATATTLLTQPQEILVSITNIDPVDCSGNSNGSITIAALGGANNSFEFSADGGQTFQAGASPFTFNNLAGGTYALVVRDALNNNCQVIRSVEVLENGGLNLTVTTQGAGCAGSTNGTATVQVNGGTPSFNYLWSDGQTTATAINLAANVEDSVFIGAPYAVTVTDANGCQASITNIAIIGADGISLALEVLQNVSCFGGNDGAAFATVTGGTGTYTLNWSNGATTDTVRNLEAFNYLVVATDANGCVDSATVALTEPLFPLTAFLSGDTTTCFGGRDGRILIDSIEGGTPLANGGYEFSLREQGPYGSDAVLTQGLPAGIYTVFVRDANACITRVDSVIIRQPVQFQVTAFQDTSIRLGQGVVLSASVNHSSFDSSRVGWSYLNEFGDPISICQGPNCMAGFQPNLDLLFQDRRFIFSLNNGCGDTASVDVRVNARQTLFVPNVFTPNGDGVNDVFTIYAGPDVRIIKRFMIFDRWGELVHEATEFAPGSINAGWDGTFKGKQMNPGVFVYYVEAETVDGRTATRKGDVTLAR